VTAVDLATASVLYRYAEKASVEQRLVTHDTLKRFALLLRKFERGLGELAKEDYWRNYLSPLRRYRFERCAAPLPFNHLGAHHAELFKELRHKLKHCEQIYPRYAESAHRLLGDAEVLTLLEQNPLLDRVRTLDLYDKRKRSALLLKEPRLVLQVERNLAATADLCHLVVVTVPQLRTGQLFDQIIVIGPMRWFRDHDYVFTSPRAPSFQIVRYGFLGDSWEPRPVFTGKGARVRRPSDVAASRYEAAPETEVVDALEMLPMIDWSDLSAKAARLVQMGGEQELVEGYLFLLEGDQAVFLDSSESSSALIVDVQGGAAEEAVRRVQVSKLEVEMFLILRTSGGGDYIVPLADQILGQRAVSARQIQTHWKGLLRRAVMSKGMAYSVRTLLHLGAKNANEVNVRNWISAKTIRSRHLEDFNAIMSFVELDEKAQDYWQNAKAIGRAHQMAGQRIRKLLLEKVKQADLGRLEQLGHMSFELPELQGSGMAAFRIKGRGEGILEIPLSQIGRVFDPEGDLWHR
jgi:hypothetical protein